MQYSQTIKRTFLALITVAVAITWTQTGHAQQPCLVSRGLDPLDVITSGVLHNVWIVLDTSGSMNRGFNSAWCRIGVDCKIDIAKAVIRDLMDRIVDSSGRPRVNWAFVYYDVNRLDRRGRCLRVDAPDDLDFFPDKPDGCIGLKDSAFVPPPLCGDDSTADIRGTLDDPAFRATGMTPIGISYTDIAEYLVGKHRPDDPTVSANTTDFVNNLLTDQKNFIIQVTDGNDTCECRAGGYPPALPVTVGGVPFTSVSELVAPVGMRPSSTDPTFVVTSPYTGSWASYWRTARDIAAYNAGLKGETALKAIDPALDGSKGNIFTIGMDLSPDDKVRLNTISWMASGARLPGRDRSLMNAALFADDSVGLVAAFEDILARVDIPSSEVAFGTSTVASVREVIPTHTNTGVSALDLDPGGSASASDIRHARIVRAEHRNNVLFTATVEVPSFRGHLRAFNIYTVTDPAFPHTARNADFSLIWDAGVELQDDNPDARPIFFNKEGSTQVLPFTTGNVLPTDLGVSAGYLTEVDGTGALTDADARDIVVKVTRGYRLSVDPSTGTIYNSSGNLNLSLLDENGELTWKLYENTAGSVAVVSNPPRSPDFDPPLAHTSKYGVGGSVPGDGFYWDHFNRKTVVYYPSNFGMLQGFDAKTGAELVAFIPDDVIGLAQGELAGSRDTLKDVVKKIVTNNNGVLNHNFTLAGDATVDDVFLRSDHGEDDEWHSLIVFGRGKGGRFITAMDITTVPSNPSSIRLLWNRGNRDLRTGRTVPEERRRFRRFRGIRQRPTLKGPIDGLGETFSTPVLGNVDTRTGPSTTLDEVDQWLVFAGGGYGCENNDNEGQNLFAFRAEDGFIYYTAWAGNDSSAAIPYNALPARPTLFNPHDEDTLDAKDFVTRLYIPDVQGNVHKLVTTDPDPANWQFTVFAAMGTDHPITAPVTLLNDVFTPNRVYVMAGSGGDSRAPVPAEGFGFRIWLDNDVEGTATTQYPVGTPADFEGVFFDGERMTAQAVTLGSIGDPAPATVFFVASEGSFDTDTCTSSFLSTLYAVGVVSGAGEFDLDPDSPETTSTSLGEGKASLFGRDGTIYVTRSGGLGVDAEVSTWGDGNFNDDSVPNGSSPFAIQLAAEGFRLSPF